jgi:hypothetical protein
MAIRLGPDDDPAMPLLKIRYPALTLLASLSGCWQIGEPTASDALVSWAAFPDTVVAGEVFSMEFAGPITPDACGRLDTATVVVGDSSVLLHASRLTYDTTCPKTPISFYEARPLQLSTGTYSIRSDARIFGQIVAVDSGSFSRMGVAGEGTVDAGGGCTLFGPGRLGNQRPFALLGDVGGVAAVSGSNRVVWIQGDLSGFTLCGSFGSRPAIRVKDWAIREGTSEDYYND